VQVEALAVVARTSTINSTLPASLYRLIVPSDEGAVMTGQSGV
jgi:hypothetical protein